jgi:hypothetical protein
MPLDVTFDEDKRLIRVTVTGAWPTMTEIIAERSRLIVAGYIRADVVELVDVRNVTKGIPNLSQMQAILHAIGRPPNRRAVVVGSNLQFGAGRLAELLDPTGIKIFREEDAALKWLLEPPPEQPPKIDRSQSGRIATFKNQ